MSKSHIISPAILIATQIIIIMLAVHSHTMNGLVRKVTAIQGMVVYDQPKEDRDMDFENFVIVTTLGAASEFSDLEHIEERLDERIRDRYSLEPYSKIREAHGNLTIGLNGEERQESYILEYPFSELDSIELDLEFLRSCVSGCSCSDMSYLNKLIGCINAMDNEMYDFSFSEKNGCSDNKFEAQIYVSKANNTWSELFPHVLNDGSPIEFSC
jgi:hypothetical protein